MVFVKIDAVVFLLIIIGVLFEKIFKSDKEIKTKNYRGRHVKNASHFYYEGRE